MTPPVRSDSHASTAVRDGQLAAVTCEVCGCRLEAADDGVSWFHFGRVAGRDARGCRVACIDLAHDARGRAEMAA